MKWDTFVEVPFGLLAILVLGLCTALSWAWVECCIISQLTRNREDVFPLKEQRRG